MRRKPLKELAENLRELAKMAQSLPEETRVETTYDKLDSQQVLNFIKFFADKG